MHRSTKDSGPMDEVRHTAARCNLLAAANPRGGWGERAGVPSRTEPTALACLALHATAGGTDLGASAEISPKADVPPGGKCAGTSSSQRGRPPCPPVAIPASSRRNSTPSEPLTSGGPREKTALAASEWLAARQHSDGSVEAAEGMPDIGWATPHAILTWRALGVQPQGQKLAALWLLKRSGQMAEASAAVVGHNTGLVGWPWIDGTHSWLEPTAWATLALSAAGHRGHPRVEEGLALILDRSIPTGGWNYGNRSVFGRTLRPLPGPTGLALLALANLGGKTPPAVRQAIRYLRDLLPGTHAGISLAWGLMGLAAWDSAPPEASGWLTRALDVPAQPAPTTRQALVLLALSLDPLACFGLKTGNNPR
jgi:hypothetical protein